MLNRTKSSPQLLEWGQTLPRDGKTYNLMTKGSVFFVGGGQVFATFSAILSQNEVC